jgi:LysM repeat protein
MTPRRYVLAAVAAAVALGAVAPRVTAQGQAANTPRASVSGQMGAHVVRSGETLFSIARRYGMPVHDLARLNGIPLTAVLLPGRALSVPLSNAVNARAGAPAAGLQTTSAAAAVQASSSASGTYTVQPGDTLFAISRRLGASVDDLRRWNGLPADGFIRAGETLVINPDGPNGTGGAAAAPPAAPSPAVDPAAAQLPAGTRDQSYVVQPGDTLSAIAARYGTTAKAIQRLNDLSGDFLQAGQTLQVPRPGQGPEGAVGAKRIEVDVSEQRMYVWQGDTLVWNFTVSTGIAGYPTRRGDFTVLSKIPNAWSSAWQLWMPHWLGIYYAGSSENGIHALPIINGQRLWAGNLGSPISFGCVVLGVDEAEMLYNWAEIGTPVTVHD